jgi:hypothetical protein
MTRRRRRSLRGDIGAKIPAVRELDLRPALFRRSSRASSQ